MWPSFLFKTWLQVYFFSWKSIRLWRQQVYDCTFFSFNQFKQGHSRIYKDVGILCNRYKHYLYTFVGVSFPFWVVGTLNVTCLRNSG